MKPFSALSMHSRGYVVEEGIAESTAHPVVFSHCWFVIGAGCGALLYLATTAAAAFTLHLRFASP